jgi:hypothetical protein
MLHIGVVFVVFGIFLLGAGLIPDDATASNAWSIFAKDSWWNELVLTGLFAIGLGVFLIVLNGVLSKKEDDDLEAYVQSQLTRSRSGKSLQRPPSWFSLHSRLFPLFRTSTGARRGNRRPSNTPHQARSSNTSRMRGARLRRNLKLEHAAHAYELRVAHPHDFGISERW